jgi:hypothetical protein
MAVGDRRFVDGVPGLIRVLFFQGDMQVDGPASGTVSSIC